MLKILRNPTYLRLFVAQVVALLGTGLLTIALGLTAFDLAGDQAGQVLGIALTIKMLAYVGLSPVATALFARLNRRKVLIAADLVRAAAALCLPFIDAAWQIYALIFVLQAASATFTPTYQAVLPDVLPDEANYTRALSLARLAYDMENLASPVLAGLLLSLIEPNWLFAGTSLGFLASAALVLGSHIPAPGDARPRPFRERLTRGIRIYLATPRLRGLLALTATVAAVSAVILVLTVVIARSVYDGAERDLAVLLGAYGAGSMLGALALPPLLDRVPDRPVMLTGALLGSGAMAALGLAILFSGWPTWPMVLLLWFLIGAALAGVMTPSGRLLRRSAETEDRPALFAAQFALSHACWLVAYPVAGWLGSTAGVPVAMLGLGAAGLAAAFVAIILWPGGMPDQLEHEHTSLPQDHPHLRGATRRGRGWIHSHPVQIDDEHPTWPATK
ncbi:MFS transporter [Pseudoruegeria sp. HB172150]|uniref:MFS transporter n=1 Tax=Pseudoruegeria sp. HB172150 TaxID=2721164 RepID=UPI00155774CE|nr:MFS transporter [Pseudoruegeria sp. HB172150]